MPARPRSDARPVRAATGRRLRRAAEFTRVYREGRRTHGTYMVQTARRGSRPHARVGMTVSRKVGNAVTRNRVRRRLAALLRGAYPALPAGCELVVTARPSAATASFGDLQADFDRCLRRTYRLLSD